MRFRPRTFLVYAFVLAAIVAAPVAAFAQSKPTTREAIVVTPAWLAQHINDPNLVLLQMGEAPEYAAGHIPGARLVGPERLSAKSDLALEMPSPDSLRAFFSELGISDNSRIVVYYGKTWVSPSTRLILTLDYAGFGGATSMLDGGQPAWVAAGNSVTTDVPASRTGKISVINVQPVVVDAAYVKDHIGKPGFAIVDARAAAFYDGVTPGGDPANPERAGHIAGAFSIPYNSTWTMGGAWKSQDELAAMFAKAGVKPGDTIIGYCHVGQQATAMLFAARTLGYRVALYDGSFQDWSAHAEYPVEKPAAKK